VAATTPLDVARMSCSSCSPMGTPRAARWARRIARALCRRAGELLALGDFRYGVRRAQTENSGNVSTAAGLGWRSWLLWRAGSHRHSPLSWCTRPPSRRSPVSRCSFDRAHVLEPAFGVASTVLAAGALQLLLCPTLRWRIGSGQIRTCVLISVVCAFSLAWLGALTASRGLECMPTRRKRSATPTRMPGHVLGGIAGSAPVRRMS
jgi:hypothetical protein